MKITVVFKLVDGNENPVDKELAKEKERKKKVGMYNERGEWVEG